MSEQPEPRMSQVARTVKQRKRTPVAAAPSNVPADPVAALRDRTWGLAEEFEHLGYPWLAAAIKGAIALSKGEH
jgi:hypothetical protein